MSMAAGEYVSVSSQADTESSDLDRERKELAEDGDKEHKELAKIYVRRGLEPALAVQVAVQLMAHDALAAHARDELGITESSTARPIQAAFASAGTFALGAALPLASVASTSIGAAIPTVAGTSLSFLAILGALSAKAGGARMGRATIRVTFWGALAMGVTAAIGAVFGTAA
jgi:VIT1/CCC1 family predicted Fe2+/Mn2+ transporter